MKEKRDSFRNEIRQKGNNKLFRDNRSRMFMENIKLSTNQVQDLKKNINQNNIQQNLDKLKCLAIDQNQLNQFLYISPFLLKLCINTKQQVEFEQAIHILINMCSCKAYNSQIINGSELIDQLKNVGRQFDVLWLFGNMLQLKNEVLMKNLMNAKIFTFVQQMQNITFSNEQNLLNFSNFLCGLLVNSEILKKQQLGDLLKLIVNLEKYENPETLFIFCSALSNCRFSNQNQTHYTIILTQFKTLFLEIIDKKKTKLLLRILQFFENISIHPHGFRIFNQFEIFRLLQLAYQNRHPQIKPTIIYILSNMTADSHIKFTKIYLQIISKIKQFEIQTDPIKQSLIQLMSGMLINSTSDEWLNAFLTFGLLDHIIWLISNQQTKFIQRGLYLLQISLDIKQDLVRLCEEKNIHQILYHLQEHDLQHIYQICYRIIDKYFKSA